MTLVSSVSLKAEVLKVSLLQTNVKTWLESARHCAKDIVGDWCQRRAE